MAGKKGRSGGAGKLSAEQHRLRGTFRQDRHGERVGSGLAVAEERWLFGLGKEARLQGVFYLQYYRPIDRLAFRRLLRAHAALERFYRAGPGGPWRADEAASRDAEHRRLRASIAELVPGVGWRLR